MATSKSEWIVLKLRSLAKYPIEKKRLALVMKAEAFVKAGKIDTLQDAEDLALVLRTVKDVRRDVDAYYKETWKDALNGVLSKVHEMNRGQANPLEAIEKRLGGIYAAWKRAEDLRHAQEIAQKQRDAIAQQQELRQQKVENIERIAETETSPTMKAALLSEAASLKQAPIVIEKVSAPAPATPAGLAAKKTYHAQVDDLMALVRAVAAGTEDLDQLLPNQTVLDAWADSSRGNATKPGVSVITRDVVSGRRL